jgi:hypothetical protein
VFQPGLASRIDVLGAPGVGKSTFCRHFLGRLDSALLPRCLDMKGSRMDATRMAFDHGLSKLRLRDRVRKGSQGLVFIFKQLLRSRGCDATHFVNPLEGLKDEDLEAFLTAHGDLFEAVVSQWFDPDIALPLLPNLPNRYREMLSWTRDLLFCTRWCGAGLLLADNARFTKAIAELLSNPGYPQETRERFAKSYIESPLSPRGMIHFYGSPQLILKRIQKRTVNDNGAMHPAHRGLSVDELLLYSERRQEINRRAASWFASNRIPVFELNIEEPEAKNFDSLNLFLMQFVSLNPKDG